jgi:hypothetical protein
MQIMLGFIPYYAWVKIRVSPKGQCLGPASSARGKGLAE